MLQLKVSLVHEHDHIINNSQIMTHKQTHILFNQPIYLELLHVGPVPKSKLLGIVVVELL